MNRQEENEQSLLKIAELYHFLNGELDSFNLVNRILKKEGDVNYQIPVGSSLSSIHPSLIGGTALHIAAFKHDIRLFNALLKNGAKFTIQNQDGSTICHYIINNVHRNSSFLDAIFSAHIEYKVPINPRNNEGLSHFHIACSIGNIKAMEYFLDNNVSVNEATNEDCYEFPGCTALHIAARFPQMHVLQLLLRHKANVHVKNAAGMTPLLILIEQKLDKFDSLSANYESRDNVLKFIQMIDDMMKLLLTNNLVTDEMFPNDNVSLTHFHVACTMRDTLLAECLIKQTTNLDYQIKMDSPIWPGYTALHFAAHCNINIVKMLVDSGANINVKDAKGVTPLDICLRKLTPVETLSTIQFKESWKSVSFANGQMKLFDLISAMKSPQNLANYLDDNASSINECLPRDFLLWPGFTPLHLAVVLSADEDRELIKECLRHGADVTLQDYHGRTPLILAFRLNKLEIIYLLLVHQPVNANPHDDEGLSHLHIACQVVNSRLMLVKDNIFKQRLSLKKIQSIDVVYKGQTCVGSVKPGSTPLHIAIANENVGMVEMLLNHQADHHIEDANGLTPIDWLLSFYPNLPSNFRIKFRLLFTRELERNADKDDGLTWLHVATCFNCEETVKKLLERKVKVDPMISCDYPSNFWSEYVGCTPLHLTILRRSSSREMISSNIFNELICNGADILAMRPNGMTPLYDALIGQSDEYVKRQITEKLFNDDHLLRRLKGMSGITILHVACYCLSESTVSKSFKEKIDVNARVNDDCKILPGCTPLHLVLSNIGSSGVDYHLELLLDNEADVTIKNAEGDTPVHSVFRQDSYDENHAITLSKLLKNHKDFSVNPIGSNGMSHFHAACIANNFVAVEQFLKQGVDVNKPIDLFAPKFAGESPLHLAINRESESAFGAESLFLTIDLLLANGAKVYAEDSHGNTVFHKIVRMESSRMKLLNKFAGLEVMHINSANIFGKTPLEMVLKMQEIPVEAMKFFSSRGFGVNAYYPTCDDNYIEFILCTDYHPTRQTEAIEALNPTEVDGKGRTILHHMVKTEMMSADKYVKLIEKLERFGMDVDRQDKSGYTALHLATQFRNIPAIEALLRCSADIDIVNANGKTALVYASELVDRPGSREGVILKLARHAKKLIALDLDVSALNVSTIGKLSKRLQYLAANNAIRYHFHKELEASKDIAIASKLRLRDLLSDSGPMADYPFMVEYKRSRINEAFLLGISDARFTEFKTFLKLQYRRAERRLRLAEKAAMDLRSLFWLEGSSIPYECLVIILRHLRLSDFVNLLVAIDDNYRNAQRALLLCNGATNFYSKRTS